MEDSGEWCTVPTKGNHHDNKNKTQRPAGNKSKGNSARKSRSVRKQSTTKISTTRSSPPTTTTTTTTTTAPNPYHLPEDNEEEDEGSSDEEEQEEEAVVPPYHTTILSICPLKDCPANEPFLDTTSLVKHLRSEHHLVFKDLQHMYIALDPYLARWAKELESKPIEEIACLDDFDPKVYIIDPRYCPLDKEIRDEMQRAKLEEVLKTQQRERDHDAKVPRKCLFCKVICDNRAILFKHMFSEHNFNIGLPDNLVNVNEFLDMLESKLSKLQCLYCEKIFTNAPVLRKHMRKKKHFKIAPRNRQYDRFYVINYLEPGKNWESFEHDNYDSDDDKRDESWADWEEEEAEPTMCLFDNDVFPSPEETLQHMKTAHGFDLSRIRKEHGLEFYKTVVLLNYIRHQSSLDKCFVCGHVVEDLSLLANHMQEKNCFQKPIDMNADFWKDPKYLLPTYENDPILTGFEGEDEEDDQEKKPEQEQGTPGIPTSDIDNKKEASTTSA
ncbi:hypothetical protein LRAMOSA05739 [Lichtheimia ramosa]|uniref:C2H2-type domain-containing protein n=1 Tax=Lichtheimia ramosa TaxID=688394 RepID=A0A077X2U6_9FUNG|nr:hypothetical protein LRAMOSA05739 [Lichtheimia ramosa]